MTELNNIEKLAGLIEKYAPHDGVFELPDVKAHVVKASKPNEESYYSISKTSLCIVAKGAKKVSLGEKSYEYSASHIVVYSAEVPVASNILKASVVDPYLCLVIDIDAEKLSELAVKVYPDGLPKEKDGRSIYLGENNEDIISASIRLIESISNTDDAKYIAPLIIDEILIRLLRGPFGASIAYMGMKNSNTYRISKSISWLKDNYAESFSIENLAEISSMSTSNFHKHFKSLTSMSPLQFQKIIRLQEAKRLMTSRMMDVSSASFEVGYASVSQFSREYSRYFGTSPSKDIK